MAQRSRVVPCCCSPGRPMRGALPRHSVLPLSSIAPQRSGVTEDVSSQSNVQRKLAAVRACALRALLANHARTINRKRARAHAGTTTALSEAARRATSLFLAASLVFSPSPALAVKSGTPPSAAPPPTETTASTTGSSTTEAGSAGGIILRCVNYGGCGAQ